jgi:hypothetical protein
MKDEKPIEPSSMNSWLDKDEEPSSDMFRMTAKQVPARTKQRGEYTGGNDLHWSAPVPGNHVEREQKQASLKMQFAEWLDLFKWDWFGTYTFARSVSASGAHHMFNSHLRWLEKQAQMPLYAFRADEYGLLNGRFHLHALIANVGTIESYCGERLPPGVWGRPCCALHSWPCGSARVLKYDPEIGATGYVSKYVFKDRFGDYDVFGNFVRVDDPQQTIQFETGR